MKLMRLLAAASALFFSLSSNASAAELPDFVRLAQKAGPAVVNISTEKTIASSMPEEMRRFFEQFGPLNPSRPQKQSALGTGFIISSDGYIVTNNHVVNGADKVLVNLNTDNETTRSLDAEIIGTDPDTDIALLKVNSPKSLPTLSFGNSDEAQVGEWVMAIGNPFGLNNTVTAGILSAKGRRGITDNRYDDFLQTDASINPGNSGGPLINTRGEVIGINTAIISGGQGIGFAIPSSMAMDIIDQLRYGKKVSRGWMGVSIQSINEQMAKALKLKSTEGALVAGVNPGQPADRAGLKVGDVITRVNNKIIKSSDDLTRAIAAIKPGQDVKITVLRKNAEKVLTVRLGDRDAAQGGVISNADGNSIEKLGLTVVPLSKSDIKRYDLPQGTTGLVITKINSKSPAANADPQLMEGDVILAANMETVASPQDLAKAIAGSKGEQDYLLLQVLREGRFRVSQFYAAVPLIN